MYVVRMTPLDRPNDAITSGGRWEAPRDAWNNLLTELERDQDGQTFGETDWTLHSAYQTAIDSVLSMNLNLPGEIKVGSEYKYEVVTAS